MTPDSHGSIYQRLAQCLAEIGLGDIECRATRILVRDGFCVARVFEFEGLRAVWHLESDCLEIHDELGVLQVSERAEVQVFPLRRAA